jgi:PAS domain-containing protein
MRVRHSEDMSSTYATADAGGPDGGVDPETGIRAALDSLDTGVLLLSPELRVTYANARWTRWVGAPLAPGTPLVQLLEESARERLSLLGATLADGQPRMVQLWLCPVRADAPSRRGGCAPWRAAPRPARDSATAGRSSPPDRCRRAQRGPRHPAAG